MGSTPTSSRPPAVSPTIVCTAYGPTRRKDERAGTSSACDVFEAADTTGLGPFRSTTRVPLSHSWTPNQPLPRRAIENSRMVSSSDGKAPGGAFQLHPLDGVFVVYTTSGSVDPMKRRVE